MDFGVTLPDTGPLATPESLGAVSQLAEELGFGSLWVGDHIIIPESFVSEYPYTDDGVPTWPRHLSWLDPLLALTWVAAQTHRVLLGTSVLVLPIRQTIVVAKAVATLDHLSSGRAILGVGSGWLREEFEVLGADFDRRGARMSEAIPQLRACWGPDPVVFEGSDGTVSAFSCSPKPTQGQALRIFCGGESEVALRRVASLADGWQPFRVLPEQVSAGVSRLRELMDTAERPGSQVEVFVRPGLSIPMSVALVEQYRRAGANALIFDVDYRNLSMSEASGRLEEIKRTLMDPMDG